MSEKEEDEGGVTDSEEAMRWAAEEPTAMWDESFLEKEGFNALLKDRAANPREETGPATVEGAGGKSRTGSVEISSEVTGGHPAVTSAPRKRRSGGLSWALTIVVAVTLGFAVYALVRMLR